MARILILGGGTGGIAAANQLRRSLAREHTVTLVERRGRFHVGATKTWVMLGDKRPEEVDRPLKTLKRKGIEVLARTVTKIDPIGLSVETDFEGLSADYLIVALGADYDMASIPGLAESAETYYTLEGAIRLRDRLKGFEGGHVVNLVPRVPFKCPPAPYETAFLLHHAFQRRGIGSNVRMSFFTAEGAPMATAGPEMSQYIKEEMTKRNIAYHPLKRTKAVDSARKSVVFEDGTEASYDLLIAVPPHRAPAVVAASGLAGPSGWIPADPKSLRVNLPNVSDRLYAIGDVTVVPLPGRFKPDAPPLVLPKAGVFADAEARIVAAHIAARIQGRDPDSAFEGKGFCYIEMGGGHAVRGDGSFFDLPHPVMSRRTPDLTQYEDKQRWVSDWMKANLG